MPRKPLTSELEAIQRDLDRAGQKLGALLPDEHPRFDDAFEDIGAARYYIQEAGCRIQAAIKTLQSKGDANF